MPWATFVLLLVGGYVALKLVGLTKNKGRLKFLGLAIASSIFVVIELFILINSQTNSPQLTSVANFIIEWGHVTTLAFVLSSLAVFIRESKPVFAQFPMLYTALPLLIVLSYLLVNDTYALKTWLIAIYQGGAIVVSLLMYSVYTYRRTAYRLVLAGAVVFLMCYISYWYIPGVQTQYSWIWQILLAAAMIISVLGYSKAASSALSETTTDHSI